LKEINDIDEKKEVGIKQRISVTISIFPRFGKNWASIHGIRPLPQQYALVNRWFLARACVRNVMNRDWMAAAAGFALLAPPFPRRAVR
jgi:hypothetical protein